MTLLIVFIAATSGFALSWFAKDRITVFVTGTESFIRAIEAKAAALKVVL
jgi:hypothetical protein